MALQKIGERALEAVQTSTDAAVTFKPTKTVLDEDKYEEVGDI